MTWTSFFLPVIASNAHADKQAVQPSHLSAIISNLISSRQTFAGHYENNLGNITELQKEKIEKGRKEGWWDDEKCDWFYDTYKSKKGLLTKILEDEKFDVACLQIASGDILEDNNLLDYAGKLIKLLRENNPEIQIVIHTSWVKRKQEQILKCQYMAEKIALKYNVCVAPVGIAFLHCYNELPEVMMHRSEKDPHQNETSSFLIAYTSIFTMFDKQLSLDNKIVSENLKINYKNVDFNKFEIDKNLAEKFMEIAWKSIEYTKERLNKYSYKTLEMPRIEFENKKRSEENADIKMLVIGNAYYDNNGQLWRELKKKFEDNNSNLYIETLTDDAATFESILANNAGEFTSRQDDILKQIGSNFNKMDNTLYDADDLDGMGDYPTNMAIEFIKARKGKLDKILNKNIDWNYIIIQGFRGTENPRKHNFFGSGSKLISKIREKHSAEILLMQNWSADNAAPDIQNIINENCVKLAKMNNISIIPIGEKWAAQKEKGVNLYKSKFTPNACGIKLIVNEIFDYLQN